MSPDSALAPPKRRQELDVLRGLLLVLMAVTHLPTGLSVYSNQPFGFLSAAEGFVFLSAFLVGSTYMRKLHEHGADYVRDKLWRRAGKLYLAHLGLLAFLFTVVAALAVMSGRPALHNHLAVFFAHPVRAMLASVVLLYQPPLLDILPMYIAFLALTPWLLKFAERRGWWAILGVSGLLWLGAQFGGRRLAYEWVAARVGLRLPIDALGAFDWLAWQLVWVAGLWLGSRQLRQSAARPKGFRDKALLATAAVTAGVLLLWRYHGGFGLDLSSPLVNKWHLGALRIVNFVALGYLVTQRVLPYLRLLDLRILAMLGRASLAVFTAHVPLCVLSRGLIVDDTTPLTLAQQAFVLLATLGAMLFVAWRTKGAAGPPARRAQRGGVPETTSAA
jgi:hypothetical protein